MEAMKNVKKKYFIKKYFLIFSILYLARRPRILGGGGGWGIC
jgi:hypothetical protein